MGTGCVSFNPVPDGQTSKDYEQNTQGTVIAELHYIATVREVTVWDCTPEGIIGYKVVTDDRTMYFSEGIDRLNPRTRSLTDDTGDNYILTKNSFQGRNLTIGVTHKWIIKMYSDSKYYALVDVVPINQT
jgi:hypothetical protein